MSSAIPTMLPPKAGMFVLETIDGAGASSNPEEPLSSSEDVGDSLVADGFNSATSRTGHLGTPEDVGNALTADGYIHSNSGKLVQEELEPGSATLPPTYDEAVVASALSPVAEKQTGSDESPAVQSSPPPPSTRSPSSSNEQTMAVDNYVNASRSSSTHSSSSRTIIRSSTDDSRQESRSSTVDSRSTSATSTKPSTASIKSPIEPENPLLPLGVVTKKAMMSSGFPYHPDLYHLRVPPSEWAEFSKDIVSVTKISVSQKTLTVSAAVVTAVATGSGWLGHCTERNLRHSYMSRNVKKSLKGKAVNCGLPACIQSWNEKLFNNVGLSATLEVPYEAVDREVQAQKTWKEKLPWKKEQREAKRFRIVLTSKRVADEVEEEQQKLAELDDEEKIEESVEVEGNIPMKGKGSEVELDNKGPVELPANSPVVELEAPVKATELDSSPLSTVYWHESMPRTLYSSPPPVRPP
ncbi:MAG: hypothetical protein M1835_001743 [Candelina submexicana]|nr:MAG: hypothetical protein M1835_001743 [Candelina submexicana]